MANDLNEKIQHALTSGLLRLLAALPYRWVARSGDVLGGLLYKLPSKRKRILLTNLRLCFPEKTEEERDALGRATLQHVIRSYLERGVQWYGSAETLTRLTTLHSAIELADTYEQPTIFLGFHFAAIEAGCMYYSIRHDVASLYTPMSNKAIESIAHTQRSRFGTIMLPRGASARQTLGILKTGKPIMLAADMDFGLRDSVFVPFFGVQACTLTAVSRLAKISGARVVPFVTEVLPNYQGYALRILPPLQNYPSGDDKADALMTNQFLEEQIKAIPEQYYWVHRRFKRRPPGEPSVYQ
jgi:KDO2-lipid IV(A) lauroyltransferase